MSTLSAILNNAAQREDSAVRLHDHQGIAHSFVFDRGGLRHIVSFLNEKHQPEARFRITDANYCITDMTDDQKTYALNTVEFELSPAQREEFADALTRLRTATAPETAVAAVQAQTSDDSYIPAGAEWDLSRHFTP